MRQKAKELLEEGQVDCVIGYEASEHSGARPVFIYDAADADRLVWNEHCVHNLVTYLHDKKRPQKRGEEPPRVAIVVKPCDSRAINVLLAEQQIERERVYAIGVACEGVQEKGASADRCNRCVDRVPVVYDVLLGEPPEVTQVEDDYADLAQIEEMSPNERLAFWLREFDRCIRCYACRQVCPGCYCSTCMFERDDGLWVDAGIELSQKNMFHLGRALHLAGRCVECNECERVCPMGLPLSLLNRMLVREVDALFGHRAGREEALTPLLFELGEEGSPL
jgi:ferredoxin